MKLLIINGSPVKNGATNEIVNIISDTLNNFFDIYSICIDDYNFNFCKGCKNCYTTAECWQHDDIDNIIKEIDSADIIITVAPAYWGDIPGQLKSFIDRCTPYCNTHEPHASLKPGKKGYSVALRTGTKACECERIIKDITHFYGHMEIEAVDNFYLCGIATKEDVIKSRNEVIEFCNKIKAV